MNYIDELYNLNHKVAVLTGGGGVLAGAIGLGLAKAGATVVLLDIRLENAENNAKAIVATGLQAKAMQADVLDTANLERIANDILTTFGSIDILINLAGGNMPGATIAPDKSIFDIQLPDMEKVMSLNFNGTLYPSLVFGKKMAHKGKGAILNISSMAAYRAITRVVGYSAAKAAVSNLTRWMAMELAQKFGDGIRVNALAPGFFIGDQNRALLTNPDGSYTDRGKTVVANTPMGRFGTPEELIGACIFLCSNASAFVTGVVLPIDGGFEAFSGV